MGWLELRKGNGSAGRDPWQAERQEGMGEGAIATDLRSASMGVGFSHITWSRIPGLRRGIGGN
jgi:hypothetical protein